MLLIVIGLHSGMKDDWAGYDGAATARTEQLPRDAAADGGRAGEPAAELTRATLLPVATATRRSNDRVLRLHQPRVSLAGSSSASSSPRSCIVMAVAVNMGASFGMTFPDQGRPSCPRICRTSIDIHTVRSLPYILSQESGKGAVAPHTPTKVWEDS